MADRQQHQRDFIPLVLHQLLKIRERQIEATLIKVRGSQIVRDRLPGSWRDVLRLQGQLGVLDAESGVLSPVQAAEEVLDVGVTQSPRSEVFQDQSPPILEYLRQRAVILIVAQLVVQSPGQLPRKDIVGQS